MKRTALGVIGGVAVVLGIAFVIPFVVWMVMAAQLQSEIDHGTGSPVGATYAPAAPSPTATSPSRFPAPPASPAPPVSLDR